MIVKVSQLKLELSSVEAGVPNFFDPRSTFQVANLLTLEIYQSRVDIAQTHIFSSIHKLISQHHFL